MLGRSLLLVTLLILATVVAWLNPVPVPEQPEQLRWVKVDGEGNSLTAWSGPWKCVFDTSTKLLWEVKSYREDIHDHQCSFSWFYEGKGVAKGGDCFIEGEASDTRDLVAAANASRYCGSKLWRLPTEHELQTLLHDQPMPGGPMAALDFFPYTKHGPYWTANRGQPLKGHFQYLAEGATSVNFATGESQNMPYKIAAFVRLVSSVETRP